MSLKVMQLVFEADHITDKSEVLLLLAIADNADDEGRAYPGRETLSRKSRLSVRATNDVTDRLQERGALRVVPRGGPRRYGRPNLYEIDLEYLRTGNVEPAPAELEDMCTPAPVAGCECMCDPATVAPCNGCTLQNGPQDPAIALQGNRQLEPKREQQQQQGRDSDSDDRPHPYDERLARLLVGNGVHPPVAASLTTERPPDRIHKEVERLKRLKSLGPIDKPGALLVKFLREEDRELPGWDPSRGERRVAA